MAFGLFASPTGFISGTAFEAAETDELSTYPSGAFNTSFWTIPEGATAEAIAGNPDATSRNGDWSDFDGYDQNKVLNVKTTLGTPIRQSIWSGKGSQSISEATGIYFDGLVSFTSFDEAPTTIDANAKIAVYSKLTSDEATAGNLVIYAKGENGEGQEFVTVKTIADNSWHRVTIKAIPNIYASGDASVGFVVFLDGNMVSMADSQDYIDAARLAPKATKFYTDGGLFLSLAGESLSFTDVAFDGTGKLDEIMFTTKAPQFAADPDVIGVGFDTTYVSEISVDGGTTYKADNPVVIATPEAPFTVYFKGVGDYLDSSKTFTTVTSGETLKIGQGDVKLAAAKIGTAKYETLQAAADLGGDIVLLQNVKENVEFSVDETTLDLNGKTVTKDGEEATAISVTSGIRLTINDSQTGGAINGPVDNQGDKANLVINGGKFSIEGNSDPDAGGCVINATLAAGKKWDTEGDYFVLVDLVTVDFSAVAGANSTCTKVTIGGVDVTAAVPATITEDQAYEVIYTANPGYEFADQQKTATVSGTAGTTAVDANGPAATAINYQVTFGANGGSGTQDAIPYTWGAAIVAPACTFEAPEKGTFNCWSNATTFATYAVGATLPTECASYELIADWTIEDSPWPTPDPQKPEDEAVAEAMTKAGFSSAAAAAIGTKENYAEFTAYCDGQTITATAEGPIKDNAVLTFALGADAYDTAITSEDITIEAYDQATGKLTVKIDGVTAGETIKSDVLAKVLTAKGGEEVDKLAQENVTVEGYAPADGEIEVTVAPKSGTPTAFFYQIELKK